MAPEDCCFWSATELALAIRTGRLSARDALERAISRQDSVDGKLNAVVVLDLANARKRADWLDACGERGEWQGPLHGVPITVKECNDVEGTVTCVGDPKWSSRVAPESEIMIQRIVQAGCVIWGKTNLPYHAMDVQSYNVVYGSSSNPWDLERTPGGSSGGGAAAVAVGIAPFELGSDVGGSIRIPAAFCGIYGHKPTWNLVPKRGPYLEKHPREISVRGPLARTPEDLAVVLGCIAGPDLPYSHQTGLRLDLPRPDKRCLADFRVAVWGDDPECRVDDEIASASMAVADALEQSGAMVDRTARPAFATHDNVAVYAKLTAANTAVGEHKEVGTSLLKYRLAQEDQQRIRAAWGAFFQEFDILICPSYPTPAFRKDERFWDPPAFDERTKRRISLTVDGEEREMKYFKALWWASLTNVGLCPSTTFPCGVGARSGLPIGLNAVGCEYHDLITIDFVRLLKDAGIARFSWPPEYAPQAPPSASQSHYYPPIGVQPSALVTAELCARVPERADLMLRGQKAHTQTHARTRTQHTARARRLRDPN